MIVVVAYNALVTAEHVKRIAGCRRRSGRCYRRGSGCGSGVTKGGALTLIGNLAPTVEFPLQSAVTREISVNGSCASSGEYPTCLELIGRGAVDVDSLISTTATLAEGAGWFEKLYKGEAGLMKVTLVP